MVGQVLWTIDLRIDKITFANYNIIYIRSSPELDLLQKTHMTILKKIATMIIKTLICRLIQNLYVTNNTCKHASKTSANIILLQCHCYAKQ